MLAHCYFSAVEYVLLDTDVVRHVLMMVMHRPVKIVMVMDHGAGVDVCIECMGLVAPNGLHEAHGTNGFHGSNSSYGDIALKTQTFLAIEAINTPGAM